MSVSCHPERKGKEVLTQLMLFFLFWFVFYRRARQKVGLTWFCWRRQWQPTPALLRGKSYGWRSLIGCSPWGCEESDTTERLHFHFSLLCIGEGNGNPLQCSCLENPRDSGAWWAAIYGVAQSWTRPKWLSSSRNLFLEFHSKACSDTLHILTNCWLFSTKDNDLRFAICCLSWDCRHLFKFSTSCWSRHNLKQYHKMNTFIM